MPWSMFSGEGHRKYLTRSETDRFLAAAQQEGGAVYAFCWLMAATGCRISEALATVAQSIDFETGHIVIECLKKRRKQVFRAVPLSGTLLDQLKIWMENGTLNRTERLWPWSRMTGYRRITEVMQRAQIVGPWATPKGLRHGFGVRAVQSGAPLNMVQRWLGHADMKTTAIYASAMGPEEREIAARTWLEQDTSHERTQTRARVRMNRTVNGSPEDISTPGAIHPQATARSDARASRCIEPPVEATKYLNSSHKLIDSCKLIHFWLYCNTLLHEFSCA